MMLPKLSSTVNSIIRKLSYKHFLILFFAVFLYEYGYPVYNAFVLKGILGLSSDEFFSEAQVIKHFLRFPLYLAFYIWSLRKIRLGEPWAYKLFMIAEGLHLVFKLILTPLAIAYDILTSELGYVGIPLPISLLLIQMGILTVVHIFFLYNVWWYWNTVIVSKDGYQTGRGSTLVRSLV